MEDVTTPVPMQLGHTAVHVILATHYIQMERVVALVHVSCA